MKVFIWRIPKLGRFLLIHNRTSVVSILFQLTVFVVLFPDSTSGLCSKGGGKVTVTAQSRQREREEKRRQKLKRSQERQKKMKSKSQNQENSGALLTDEDKSLLERWSKMQAGASANPAQSSQKKHRLKSDSSVGGANESVVQLQSVSGQSSVGQDRNVLTEDVSNKPSVQLFSNSNKLQQLPTSQTVVGSVKNVAQMNMTTVTSNVNRPGVTNQRRIMPKDTAKVYATGSSLSTLPNSFAIMAQLPVGQTVGTNPATSQGGAIMAQLPIGQTIGSNPATSQGGAIMTQLPVGQTIGSIPATSQGGAMMTQLPAGQAIGSNPATSQGGVIYATDVTHGGITIPNAAISNQPQTQYVIPQQPVSSVVPQHSVSSGIPQNSLSSIAPQRVMSSSLSRQNPVTSASPQPTVASVVPLDSVASGSSTLLNNQQDTTNSSDFTPINSIKPGKASISNENSYRTRIYSDRETPSPPQPLSPPTYEQAMKAIHDQSQNGAEEQHDSLGSLDEISPFKPSPQASGLPFGKITEPPDIASVIQQFSKQAVEDILPPTLALTPRGDGAGYGLSLDFEELLGGTLGMASGGQQPQPEASNE